MSNRKSGFKRQADDYLQLLRLLGEENFPRVAKDLSLMEKKQVTESAVRGRLIRGRRLSEEAEQFITQLNQMRKSSRRIRKFSLSAELREQEGVNK